VDAIVERFNAEIPDWQRAKLAKYAKAFNRELQSYGYLINAEFIKLIDKKKYNRIDSVRRITYELQKDASFQALLRAINGYRKADGTFQNGMRQDTIASVNEAKKSYYLDKANKFAEIWNANNPVNGVEMKMSKTVPPLGGITFYGYSSTELVNNAFNDFVQVITAKFKNWLLREKREWHSIKADILRELNRSFDKLISTLNRAFVNILIQTGHEVNSDYRRAFAEGEVKING